MSPAFYMQKQNFLCRQKQNAYTESALMFLLMIWYDVGVKRYFAQTDACLIAQDKYKAYLDYFWIAY